MERTYIKDLLNQIDEEVLIKGSVHVRRDHGKLIFVDIRDVSGIVQAVVLPNHEEAIKVASEMRPEWVIAVKGKVNKRPEKMINKDQPLGTVELEVLEIEALSKAQELPFELGTDLNIDTHLDYLPLTLRDEKHRAVFAVQARIVKAFRDFHNSEAFTEIQVPKLIGDDAEGGANSFNVEYFKHTAHLAQSPQLYKQIMVGVYERVFSAGNVYRAEKHATSRHLNEYTSLDIEMGFVKDHTDVMKMENAFLSYMEDELREHCADEFKLLSAEIPKAPKEIPSMKLREAQELITKETGKDCTKENDLEPEHERWLCEYATKELNSEYIFITHFPTSKRPFYTYRDEKDPMFTNGADLLFRGVEITTLAQRIHNHDDLVASMKEKGLESEQFSYYLQAFKYGIAPHGGYGMGLERLTAKMLGIENVKLATLFPRDINRIDGLLST